MIDIGDRPVGRPRKSLKNYEDLMLKEAQEANRLQQEANVIALRRLIMDKKTFVLRAATAFTPILSKKQVDKIKSELEKV